VRDEPPNLGLGISRSPSGWLWAWGHPQASQNVGRSAKGYELYSWPAGNDWCFVLVTGTNRLKTYQELTATDDAEAGDWVKIKATGVEALKAVLGRLPRDEAVMWIGEGWLEQVGGAWGNLSLPDQRAIDAIRAHCQQLGIDLQIAD